MLLAIFKNQNMCNQERVLTARVQTRAYRSPEVILMDPHYDFAIDMWSAGAVIAELLRVQLGIKENYSCLFQSTHCFPLTSTGCQFRPDGFPAANGHILESIFAMIGSPTSDDICFLDDKNAKYYLSKFASNIPPSLHLYFPGVGSEAIQLLESLLQFNPYFRATAAEALSLPYFD